MSREGSPGWLRTFEELNDSVLALSSDSEPENSPPREDDGESLDLKMSQLQSRGNSEDAAVMGISEESPSKQASKGKPLKKSPKGKGHSPKKEKNQMDSQEKEGISGDVEMAEKEASDKRIEPHVSSSTLPLVLSEKVQHTKMFDQYGNPVIECGTGKGTTAGTLKFNRGLAAYVDSRKTKTHEDKKKSYGDGRKFCTISRKSNLLYIGCGWAASCKHLAESLSFDVGMAEKIEENMEAFLGNIIEASLGIQKALQLAQRNLNRMAHSEKYNKHNFGGILFGYGPNKEYKAYFIGFAKPQVLSPRCVSDDPFSAFGSGAIYALRRLNELNFNPQGTAETCLDGVKSLSLFTYLHTSGSGGPTNVFLLNDGQDLKDEPDHILDPVTVHLEDHEFSLDKIVLLIVAKEDAGEFDDIERGIGAWSGVVCASRLASRKNFWVYRILCVNANGANEAVNRLKLSPVDSEKRDSDIPPFFGHYFAPLKNRAVAVYAGKCSRERLEFIKEW